MTWEQAPEWVQALGKHHSELLREAIVALKRDSVDFRQMLLSVGETRYDVDRERSINWSYNIQDLADAGEDTLNSQLVEQRSHEAYLETLSAYQLAVVLSHGEVRAARGTTRLRDVLQSGALPPQIRRLARLLSRSEVEAALRELDNPEVAAHNRLVVLGRTTTSGVLRALVYSAVSKHDRVEAQRVTHNASWDGLVRPSSRYRVRAAGSTEDQARVLLSPSVCGTLPGDELSDSICCALPTRAPSCTAWFLHSNRVLGISFYSSRTERTSTRQLALCAGPCWSTNWRRRCCTSSLLTSTPARANRLLQHCSGQLRLRRSTAHACRFAPTHPRPTPPSPLAPLRACLQLMREAQGPPARKPGGYTRQS